MLVGVGAHSACQVLVGVGARSAYQVLVGVGARSAYQVLGGVVVSLCDLNFMILLVSCQSLSGA